MLISCVLPLKFKRRFLKMYGKEGCPKVLKKTHSGKLAVLLAENSGSEEENESPAPSSNPWHTDFNKYLEDGPEDIPPGMSLVQWWCVRVEYSFNLVLILL